MRITYDKLVRDGIPKIIEDDGHTCSSETLDRDAFVAALKRKLVEEATEAARASSLEDVVLELADLGEVVRALAGALDIDERTIEAARLARLRDRGGFERRILLRYVDRV